MQAMILAAGLGTRLRPWTLEHPKALVPVDGVPMLERVIVNLRAYGFDKIVVNAHHFSSQIIDFLSARNYGVDIVVSDESARLLDTGGGVLKAYPLFEEMPVLVHNVDILSNADLSLLMRRHMSAGSDCTLLVSGRDSSRKLIFDDEMVLKGWHNIRENVYRPEGFKKRETDREYAFSGIYVVGEGMMDDMRNWAEDERFPIMDYLLSPKRKSFVRGFSQENLELIDIGKPETLERANELLS